MAKVYTTDGLIENVKRRGAIPVSQATFTPTQILLFGDDEIMDTVVPMVRRHRNDHFVTYEDQTTTSATSYDIPAAAMNRGIFNAAILDSAGNPVSITQVDLHREIDVAWSYDRAQYYFEGDKIILRGHTSGTTLRLYYERLPNRLCYSQAYSSFSLSAQAGLITSIDTGTGVITCSGGVPSTISTSTPICAVKSTPGFYLRFSNVTPSGKTSTTVTVSAANSALVAVGDYIALDGDSPIVQLPPEAHSVLAQAIVVKCLESMSDTEGMQLAQSKLDKAIANYATSFPLRSEKGVEIILSRNRLADFM